VQASRSKEIAGPHSYESGAGGTAWRSFVHPAGRARYAFHACIHGTIVRSKWKSNGSTIIWPICITGQTNGASQSSAAILHRVIAESTHDTRNWGVVNHLYELQV
jgi:hypothetical protein